MPEITWRAGLDLNPLDATDPEQAGWLEALIWPEQTDRLSNFRAAIGVASASKPRVVKGDLRSDLAGLAREAPRNATVVIFHSAVLTYVSSAADRQRFAREASSLCDYWISNESPRVFPDIARLATRPGSSQGMFLLSINGIPVGWADPHGTALEWSGDSRSFLKT
jgi:hypothetical protein